MRTIVRVGALCGALGAVAAVALQSWMGLGITRFVVLAGICAGLGTAKWLERAWYGRQLRAGFRAGAIASGASGIAAFAALVAAGPQDTAALSARSDVILLTLPPAKHIMSSLGWPGTDVVAVALAMGLGAVLAALVTQLFAWSKSRRTVEVVEQARLAAQALAESTPQLPPAPTTPRIPVAAAVPLLSRPTGVPPAARSTGMPAPARRATGMPAGSVRPTEGARPTGAPAAIPPRRTLAPAASAAPAAPVARQQRAAVQTPPPAAGGRRSTSDGPPPPPAPDAPAAGQSQPPRARRRSSARPVEQQLTGEMRAALEAWAEEHGASDETPAVSGGDAAEPAPVTARTPQASTYLNKPGPRPKRNRKKNQTRDWIC